MGSKRERKKEPRYAEILIYIWPLNTANQMNRFYLFEKLHQIYYLMQFYCNFVHVTVFYGHKWLFVQGKRSHNTEKSTHFLFLSIFLFTTNLIDNNGNGNHNSKHIMSRVQNDQIDFKRKLVIICI